MLFVLTTNTNLREQMPLRQQQKQDSRERILLAASRRLRAQGLKGPAIAAVMKDAGARLPLILKTKMS